MGDLEGLKKVLRSLVVSTPTTMDAATLLRDYRRMLGEPLPCARHGYRDPVLFLRERCSDCFLFQGPLSNPVLTLIVPDAIKHIDQYVQRQKMPTKQIRGKRRSVPESIIRNPHTNLITSTYRCPSTEEPNNNGFINDSRPANSTPGNRYGCTGTSTPVSHAPVRTDNNRLATHTESPKPEPVTRSPVTRSPVTEPAHPERVEDLSVKRESLSNGHASEEPEGGAYSRQRLQRFLERRVPAYQAQRLGSRDSLQDDDSGRQTSSSLSSRASSALATLQAELTRLVARRPDGVWCSELLRLYEEEYGRELPFARFRYPSVSACACAVEALAATRAADGDWLLRARAGPAPAPAPAAALRVRRTPRDAGSRASLAPLDPDDALPGIDYDPDVFPADCLSFLESIPAGSVGDVEPGDMLALVVGEVYSPSHLWVLRLGPEHERMEEIMDEMTEYYSKGEGKDRVLAAGARRPGQYCSSVFEDDWHRSLIVQILDSDTVKVRHVDYGTVDTVGAAGLRPLRRAWAALPAQAVRARLAGLRPAARSRRWPRAAAAACLALVRERRLVGNVVACDREENILELFLIDTSTDEDVNITDELIRAGHADPRPRPALGARESYLFPLFRALEAGATPNYAEIHALLRDGIALEFVEAYRAHVPALLPSDDERSDGCSEPDARSPRLDAEDRTSELGSSPGPSPPPPPPPLAVTNRVPFLPIMRPDSPEPELVPSRSPTPVSRDSTSDSGARQTPELAPGPEVDSTPVVPSSAVPASSTFTPNLSVGSNSTVAGPATTSSSEFAPSFAVASSFSIGSSPAVPSSLAIVSSTAGAADPAVAAVARAAPWPRPARAPHPPAFYALPYCPCPQAAGAAYAFPPPPPAPPAPAYVFGACRPAPAGPPRTYGYYGGGLLPTPAGYGPPPPPRAPAPAPPPRPGAVRLSADECEVFELLSRVDPGAAHRYMSQALRRARAAAAPALNPEAAEFRLPAPRPPPPALRPPPGFENVFK